MIAVMGLFRSGSSVLSQILVNLGVHMGYGLNPYYEDEPLAIKLREWFDEPWMKTRTEFEVVVSGMQFWHSKQPKDKTVGVKHPLLCLCGNEMEAAWGTDTKWLVPNRNIEESIISLKKMSWWPNCSELQHELWRSRQEFLAARPHHIVNFSDMVRTPEKEIGLLVNWLNLTATPTQINNAVQCVIKRE